MTGKDILPEKDLLEKAAAINRFEYSPLVEELKQQTRVSEKQYKNLTVLLNLIKRKKTKKKKEKRSRDKSNLVDNNYFNLYKYHDINDFIKRSPESKVDCLKKFRDNYELFYYDTEEIKPNNKEQIKDL